MSAPSLDPQPGRARPASQGFARPTNRFRPFAPSPNWRADFNAGFLVFLIALPLSLGIAMASGVPPISGIVTAVIGGIVTSLLGGAELTIKGPAAGLIVICLGAVQELGGDDPLLGARRMGAVVALAGLVQVIMALFRLGKWGDAFPTAVVHGMLAAIGVIILSKQIHTLMGVTPLAHEPLQLLAEIPHSLSRANPEVLGIGVVSLAVLFGLPKAPVAWLRKVPAPLVVLLVAIPLGALADLAHPHFYQFNGHDYSVGPKDLVSLPAELLSAIPWMDASQLFTVVSMKYVVMFSLVGTIESLLSAKAIDALDPRKGRSDLDRDLLATGIGNTLAGVVGALPMISEIVRSSANLNNGARSRWANVFHGLFMLAFVGLLPGLLHLIPLSALAAMLIYTGVRLSSPKEFKHVLEIGVEQLGVFVVTMAVTLATDLLVGVAVGIVAKVVIHMVRGVHPRDLWQARITHEHGEGNAVLLRVHSAAAFTNLLGLQRHIEHAADTAKKVVLDVSEVVLIDHTTLHRLHHMVEDLSRAGLDITLVGLEKLEATSAHPFAVRRQPV